MANIFTHFNDCERLIGKGFIRVHRELDEYANKYPPQKFLEYHRQFRHTEKYLNNSGWGFYEILAAKIHIIRDYELYVLNKPFSKVEIEEIDELWQKVLKYLPK